MYEYNFETPYGGGDVRAQRMLVGRRSLAVHAAKDRVEAGLIGGKKAILVHPADDSSGLGFGQVVMIEDDEAPEFTILHISAENGIPFSELIKIAEGVSDAK